MLTKNEDIVKKLSKEYNVYNVIPGVTGWAQINGRIIIHMKKRRT